jgi:predicted acylesterase/phospholipase RssA
VFISNLNLVALGESKGSLYLANSSKIEPDGTYSVSAVEFYRLFPEATQFKLSTAVRMSASFPFVSPSTALPTNPPRRVVDAGYYDNYGVNLAARPPSY